MSGRLIKGEKKEENHFAGGNRSMAIRVSVMGAKQILLGVMRDIYGFLD